jgi:hypothetical protein
MAIDERCFDEWVRNEVFVARNTAEITFELRYTEKGILSLISALHFCEQRQS